MITNDLDPNILNKILLIQNAIWVISSFDKLCDLLSAGLKDIPGIDKIIFFSSHPRFNEENNCKTDESAKNDIIILELKTINNYYGFCQICLNNSKEFELYKPFIENLFSFFSIYLENLDIQKRIKNENIELIRKFQTILDNSPILFSQLSSEGNYIFVNKFISNFLNLKSEQIIGKNINEFLPKNDVELFLKRINHVIKTKNSISVLDNLFFNRKKHLFESILFPILNEKGIVDSIGSIAQDITDKVVLKDALSRSEERFRVLISAIANGIWIWNKSQNIIEWDENCFKLLGLTPRKNSFTLVDWKNLIHDEDKDYFFSQLDLQILQKGQFQIEYRLKTADNKYIWVECSGGLITGSEDSPSLIVGMHIDISARKKAEEERNEIQIQLIQAQKSESLGSLASGIAHDFNNLLTVIKGYSDLLSEDVTNPEALEKVDLIQTAVDRAIGLTSQLLAYSRKQVLNKEKINVSKIIEHLIKMLNRVISENIEIRFHHHRKELYIMADPTQFEQIIMNIILNARDAMLNGGKLIISVLEEEIGEEIYKSYDLPQPGVYIKIDISDNGIGMTEETQKRLFEPFFTTKIKGKGTGLGLAVANGVVKQHLGVIKVKSKLNEGTTFSIYLPEYKESYQPVSIAKSIISSNIIEQTESTIIIIEDQTEIRDFTEKILEARGYKVLTFSKAEEAFLQFSKNPRICNLMISDIALPEKSGIWLINEIKKLNNEIKIIVISGHIGNEEEKKYIKEQNLNFLQKPFSIEILIALIQKILKS